MTGQITADQESLEGVLAEMMASCAGTTGLFEYDKLRPHCRASSAVATVHLDRGLRLRSP